MWARRRQWLTVITVASALGAGCESESEPLGPTIETAPGTPRVVTSSAWMAGEPQEVVCEWHNASECNFDDWFCREPPGLTTTVLAVTCDGCTLLDDPTGTTMWSKNWQTFHAVAPIDGPTTIRVMMRFDATGDVATVTAQAHVDREVAIAASVGLVDRAQLVAGQPVPMSAIRTSATFRTASDVIAVFPAIRTVEAKDRFPWCDDDCAVYGERARPFSAVTTTPPSLGVWYVFRAEYPEYKRFLAVELAADVRDIELRAPLSQGSVSATVVQAPALEPVATAR